MKQIFILLICTFFFFGCEKMFKYDKLNSLPLNTLDDYNVSITGLYSKLLEAVFIWFQLYPPKVYVLHCTNVQIVAKYSYHLQ